VLQEVETVEQKKRSSIIVYDFKYQMLEKLRK
jgi:hypothetical protein